MITGNLLREVKKPEGRKYDQEKLRYDLMPTLAYAEVVNVLTYGANKYDDENWRHVPDYKRRYIAACIRHIEDYRQEEKWDSESGFHHLAHAICCLLFITELDLEEADTCD